MKAHLRRYVASALLLLLPAALSLAALPSGAMAQPAAPQVRSLKIDADAGYDPGSSLRIRVVGSPRLRASVRIRGVREPIALRETGPGVYVGRYTIRRTDRVGPDSDVRAMLRRGNHTVVASYELGQAMGEPPVATAPPPSPSTAPRPMEPLRIERFAMLPIDRLEPGAELEFVLEGMRGATVSLDLPGVDRDVRLRETRPGHYEGSYTLRRSDDIRPHRPIVATLRYGERAVTANLPMLVGRPGMDSRPASADNGPALPNSR